MMHLQLRVRKVTASHGHQVERLDLLVGWCHVLPSEIGECVVRMELQTLVILLSLLHFLSVLSNLLIFIWVLLLQLSLDLEVDGFNQILQLA